MGSFRTVDFTGFPDNTFITSQYETIGVVFTDGNDNVACCSEITFPQDGAGLDGNAAVHLLFAAPQRCIAVDFPGGLQIELFSGGDLVHVSSEFGLSGTGFFAGLMSTEPFDAAVMRDWVAGDVFLDDLHFGVAGPPGDLNGDWLVDVSDLLILLGAWGSCPLPPDPCPGDIDGDGTAVVGDLLIMLANWSTS